MIFKTKFLFLYIESNWEQVESEQKKGTAELRVMCTERLQAKVAFRRRINAMF
jgi:hypothetical protein